ncbi:hypothetical protein AB6A23_26470 [Paenibacillus tarimensis]
MEMIAMVVVEAMRGMAKPQFSAVMLRPFDEAAYIKHTFTIGYSWKYRLKYEHMFDKISLPNICSEVKKMPKALSITLIQFTETFGTEEKCAGLNYRTALRLLRKIRGGMKERGPPLASLVL